MALTYSTMLPLGTKAPAFNLPDPTGKLHKLRDFYEKKLLLVMVICNHCPYVVHIRKELAAKTKEYMAKGVAVVAINANNVQTHPADAPEKMLEESKNAGYEFPYLYDESQKVVQALGAACTPDFFLFDAKRELIYTGRFDDSSPGKPTPVTGRDLTAAIESALRGEKPSSDQKPSMGCNIKWIPGNEPAYFKR